MVLVDIFDRNPHRLMVCFINVNDGIFMQIQGWKDKNLRTDSLEKSETQDMPALMRESILDVTNFKDPFLMCPSCYSTAVRSYAIAKGCFSTDSIDSE